MKEYGKERKTYTLPVGPQHPMYVEAENLMVHVDGETIADVEVNIGYMHRGIEELMQRRNYIQNIYLAERICGICSGIHSVTYCQMVDMMLGLEIPDRARFIRTIVLELERLHSHFMFLGVMGYEMGLDTVFQYSWKDREYVMDILEELSGNRVNYAMPTVGGVRQDMSAGTAASILRKMPYLRDRARYYVKVFSGDRAVLKRTEGIGLLSRKDANKYSAQGPIMRASGVDYDVRRDMPYAAYHEIRDWNVITRDEGDVNARIIQKAFEIPEAVSIIEQALKRLPEGGIRVKAPLTVPESEAMCITEAPRGELVYHGRSDGTDKPDRIRIRTPSFSNVLSLPPMLREQQLADLPVIVGSIDPCFSCTDRVTLVDINSGDTKTVNETYLKKMGER